MQTPSAAAGAPCLPWAGLPLAPRALLSPSRQRGRAQLGGGAGAAATPSPPPCHGAAGPPPAPAAEA
eukprot:4184939-Pyramimonas_sp.AAC.1